MTLKTLAAAGCASVFALSGATAALAQAPAAPRPAAPAAGPTPQVTHGPPIAGLCMVSPDQVLASSTVGKYVQTRLQQLAAQVNAELTAEQTAIETDAKALDAQRATLAQDAFEQRGAAVQVRASAFQRKAQQRQREMEATRDKAISRVYDEMEPFISQVYQQKVCSVLLNRQAIVVANPAGDITGAVTTALNAKITQFAFDRERLDQAPAPAAAAAPRR
ncbi:OmpH family outer membrane protein [Phenylobacterium sp.]|uniref:OmpH family outer membrane protein n=1 Tax=Phenylobacterium sp. TaxID=1871053 RepID=UPI0025E958FE|nr:OmpH family outer membrane protein [Phenylobacterium sp.]